MTQDQDRVAVIRAATQELFTTLDIEERLRRILQHAMQSVQANAGSILLYDAPSSSLVFRYVVGGTASELTGRILPEGPGIAWAVFKSGESQLTIDPSKDPNFNPEVGKSVNLQTTGLITVPLLDPEHKPLGVLQVVNKAEGNFTADDLALLEILGDVAALAIQNAELAKEASLGYIAKTLGDLGHDLKNKVGVISGWVETIRPSVEEIQQTHPDSYELIHEALEAIHDAADDVFRDTQLVAEAVKGTLSEPRLEPHSLTEIALSRIKTLESVAKQKGIELDYRIDSTPVTALDRNRAERMFENLVRNAIDATPSGGKVSVLVSTWNEEMNPNSQCLIVQVQDTGQGMTPHKLQQVLHGQASSNKPNGTGLGTRIIWQAIQAHKAQWEGESEVGKGTLFRIKIPIAPPA